LDFHFGCAAVLIVMCSEIIGFGLASFLQVPMTDITLLLIFVVIGVGVDDVIVVVDYFDLQEPAGPDQLPNSLSKQARPAIFSTSFTNLIPFSIAAAVDFPAARWFCITAGITIFALFPRNLHSLLVAAGAGRTTATPAGD
jgi:predicted RND superfamily exporter protein